MEVRRMNKVVRISLVLALAALALAGCELLSSGGEDSGDTGDLLAQYGGFTMENEQPGFGDETLLTEYPEDEPYDDPMEDDPRVSNAARNGHARVYRLRLVWGNLRSPDSTGARGEDCPVTDWSGSVKVEGGVLIVKRLIRFDPGDRIVRPRPGPEEVEWISYTQPHLDGLVLTVIDTPEPEGSGAPDTVTITTPLATLAIPLDSLADYRDFIEFDECNKLSIMATKADLAGCPRGFLEGAWVAETDSSGFFKGVWIGHLGGISGHIRGRWVREAGGSRKLYGKYISRSGAFRGLIRGTWMPGDRENGPDGYFEGLWVDRSFAVQGYIKGHYRCCREEGCGFFHGRWVQDCR
jgi:hypothetical protein